jgi:hypothetical protein
MPTIASGTSGEKMVDEEGVAAPDVDDAGITVWGCCGDQFERQSGMWLEPAEIRGAFLPVHAVPVRLLIDRGGRAHPLPAARVTRLGDSNVSARVTCSVVLSTSLTQSS